MSRLLVSVALVLAALLALPALAGADVRGDFDGDGVDDAVVSAPWEKVGGDAYAGAVHVIYGKRKSGLRSQGSQFFTQDTPGIGDETDPSDYFGYTVTAGDFDGDGVDDLAISAPYEDVAVTSAGIIHVLYGKKKQGLQTQGSQIWDSSQLRAEEGSPEYLGYYALAADDFDGDGADDLAIENSYADVAGQTDAGAVRIVYGKKKQGLRSAGNQLLSKATPGVGGDPLGGEYFGYDGLITGDFNDDGRADLASNICYEPVGASSYGGAVYVLYGEKSGLSGAGSQRLTQDTKGIAGSPDDEYWGYASMAAGNFDGRDGDDLAIGNYYANGYAGTVSVVYSKGNKGLSGKGSDRLREGAAGVAGQADPDEQFGAALAAGNYDDRPGTDLAISATYETIGGNDAAGALFVVYGARKKGFGERAGQIFSQDTPGIGNGTAVNEEWGWTLAPGNFDGRGGMDLIVGAPYEVIGGFDDAGAVDVLSGREGDGLSGNGAKRFSQETSGIAGDPEIGDRFGYALMTPSEN